MGRRLLRKHGGVDPASQPLGFEKHAAQAAAEEEDGDGHVFEIDGRPFPAPVGQVFEEHVGDPVGEDDAGFDEFRRADVCVPLSHHVGRGFDVPCPPEIGPTTEEAPEGQQAIQKEDSALDEMRQTIEHLLSALTIESGGEKESL